MSINIETDDQFSIDVEFIGRALQIALQTAHPRPETAVVNIIISDEALIQQLNLQFRGVNSPTDVLSFENTPDSDFPQVGPPTHDYLGDIVIAYPLAQKQAQAHGHTSVEEVALLAVHGALHLLGFDHDTAANKQRMWAVQKQIMIQLGLGHVQPTET